MNCLYITLFFNIVGGIVQTFIKSWKQLLAGLWIGAAISNTSHSNTTVKRARLTGKGSRSTTVLP